MTVKRRRRTTMQAKIACAKWLSYCLEIGWGREDLDTLESLWWKYHDRHGKLIEG